MKISFSIYVTAITVRETQARKALVGGSCINLCISHYYGNYNKTKQFTLQVMKCGGEALGITLSKPVP